MFQQIQEVPKLNLTVVSMASCGMQARWPGCELGTRQCRPCEARTRQSMQCHAASAHTVPHLAHATVPLVPPSNSQSLLGAGSPSALPRPDLGMELYLLRYAQIGFGV